MYVYRITTAKWANVLSASGYPARWNGKGVFSLYTAESRSLACLENLVHRSGSGIAANFKVITIEIPDDLEVEIFDVNKLAKDWKLYRQMRLSQNLGNEWYRSQRTCILKVPSAIIPEESNYLINTSHIYFRKIKFFEVNDFLFDERLGL